MRTRVIHIGLLVIVLMASVKPVVPVMAFYLNQEYISSVLCINKDRPELHCDGKCFLSEKLRAQADEEQEKGLPVTGSGLELMVWFLPQEARSWPAPLSVPNRVPRREQILPFFWAFPLHKPPQG